MKTLSRRATWVIIALSLVGLFGNIVTRPTPPEPVIVQCDDIGSGRPAGGGSGRTPQTR